jgi:hypothetical protein
MKKKGLFVLLMVMGMLFVIFSQGCTGTVAKHTDKSFQYALPDQPEWTVKLDQPLKVVRQEIQSTDMPRPVWDKFPLPEFQERISRTMPLVHPDIQRPYGYGMDTAGCVPEALLKTNAIKYYGWGVAGGQYAYYQRVEKIDDALLYDPRQHAFLIAYNDAYLEVTFPDLRTMRVRRLKPPDMSTVKHCGPHDDVRCRFENCDD